jgi:predicted metal-dependent peptidase
MAQQTFSIGQKVFVNRGKGEKTVGIIGNIRPDGKYEVYSFHEKTSAPSRIEQEIDDINQQTTQTEWSSNNPGHTYNFSKPKDPTSAEHQTNKTKEFFTSEGKEHTSQELGIMGAIGLNRVVKRASAKKLVAWRKALQYALQNCFGWSVVYDPEAENPRYEDQPGKDVDVQVPKHVVFLMDNSGSMEASKFESALIEIRNFLQASKRKLSKCEFHLILWSDNSPAHPTDYTKLRNFNNLTGSIETRQKEVPQGGTYPDVGFMMMMKKVPKPDVIIVLTDAEWSDSSRDTYGNITGKVDARVKGFIKSHYDHLIWVLIPGQGGSTPAEQIQSVRLYDEKAATLTDRDIALGNVGSNRIIRVK